MKKPLKVLMPLLYVVCFSNLIKAAEEESIRTTITDNDDLQSSRSFNENLTAQFYEDISAFKTIPKRPNTAIIMNTKTSRVDTTSAVYTNQLLEEVSAKLKNLRLTDEESEQDIRPTETLKIPENQNLR